MRILLLCNYDPYNAAMVTDHINAFHMYSAHEVVVFSHMVNHGGDLPDDLSLDFFDAVILHYSLFLAVDAYVSDRARRKIKAFKGIKAIFLQDEYRFVHPTVERIGDLGFDIIFTCVPESSIEQVYPAEQLPGVQRVNVLTGYVPPALVNYQPIPLNKRRYDVSYRGRQYPEWHGRLGLEKWRIAEDFRKEARKHGLRMNISCRERDRVYGRDWVHLLQNSRAVLGVESGASVFDFTGLVSAKVDTVSALLGKRNAHYAALRERYFADIEDQIQLAQISPRVFEAIALRTLCILYEGDYSGILEPWRHYLPLKKDHSNVAEIVEILKDPWRISEIVANAYAEVALNPAYSYRTFVQRVDGILTSTLSQRQADRKSEDELIEEDIKAELIRIRERYPFYFTPNPHGLENPTPKVLTTMVRGLRRVIPARWLRGIRNIFR